LFIDKTVNIMGRAIEKGLRDQLILLKQQGKRLSQISEELHLPIGTVNKLSSRYKRAGHLQVGYSRCGPQGVRSEPFYLRASLWLKRLHPQWGASLIRLKLEERYGSKVPSGRSLQRWFRSAHLTKPRQQQKQAVIGQAKAVHNIWQVDAKEHLTLNDGSEACYLTICYLTITDEHSGAGLAGLVFPPQAHQSSAS
jgi:transposase